MCSFGGMLASKMYFYVAVLVDEALNNAFLKTAQILLSQFTKNMVNLVLVELVKNESHNFKLFVLCMCCGLPLSCKEPTYDADGFEDANNDPNACWRIFHKCQDKQVSTDDEYQYGNHPATFSVAVTYHGALSHSVTVMFSPMYSTYLPNVKCGNKKHQRVLAGEFSD